ncbi:MAG TPA: arsenate reductase family protein [Bacteroidia bacterium]|nr:arsenate reductase family protein [Bacteroidia bacterium]
MGEGKLIVWHKPNCAKSLEVMKVLRDEGVKPEIFEYLVEKPTVAQLKDVLGKLGMRAEALVRKKEPIFKEKFEGKRMTEEKWIKAMVKYPILIERPILIKGDKAIIGRPTERVKEFI